MKTPIVVIAYSLCRPHQWALSSLSLSSFPSSPPSSSDWSPSRSNVGLLTPSTSSRTGAMLCRLSSAESPMAGRAKVFVPPISVLELLLLPLLLPSPALPGSWPSGLLSLESCRSMATVPETYTEPMWLKTLVVQTLWILDNACKSESTEYTFAGQFYCWPPDGVFVKPQYLTFLLICQLLLSSVTYNQIHDYSLVKAMHICIHPERFQMWELHNSDSRGWAAAQST